MTIQDEIQKRVKEGQEKIAPVLEGALESARSNQAIETIVASGKEVLDRPELQKFVTQGQDIAGQAKSQVDDIRSTLLENVRNVEVQGKQVLQSSMTQVLDNARTLESTIIEAANRALDEGEKFAEEKLPFLTGAVAKAREAVQTIDATFAKIQATAAVSANSMPINDYDKLNAKAAASAVKKLNQNDLLAVKAYESANKKRSTVLKEIDHLLSA